MNLFLSFLSSRGRLNRARFWIYSVINAVIYTAFVVGSEYFEGGPSGAAFALLKVLAICLCLWISVAIGIRRLHDRDKSGSWILLQFIPVLGFIWYFIECFCRRGTRGANRFGPDPLDPHDKILAVFSPAD